ncbi:MAG: YoaK family protein [Actinomycetota bacterium]
MLTAVCGLIGATTFLALGSVFAEIMTGNLMFLAFEIGQGEGRAALPTYAVPLVTFSVGAVGGGYVLHSARFPGRRRHPFAAVAVLIALALALTIAWQPVAGSVSAMVVVGVLAFAMGIQNAAVLHHLIPDVATNVMTLTLVRLLSNLSIIGGDNARWRFRVASLATFFAAAALGAALVRLGPAAGLGAALAVYLIALPFLMLSRSPSDPVSA